MKTRHQRQLGFGVPLKINRLDHLVLTVKDIEAVCAFYTRVLGMGVITFGSGRKALAFGGQRINLHEGTHTGSDLIIGVPSEGQSILTGESPVMVRVRAM